MAGERTPLLSGDRVGANFMGCYGLEDLRQLFMVRKRGREATKTAAEHISKDCKEVSFNDEDMVSNFRLGGFAGRYIRRDGGPCVCSTS